MNIDTDKKIMIILTLCCLIITLVQFIEFDSDIDDKKATPMLIEHDSVGYVKGTGSMEPFITSTAKIFYKYDFELDVGDIYVYHVPETNKDVIHRLVYIDDDYCFFKGDHNVYIDKKINCSQIIKKVVAIEFDRT